MKPSNYLKGLYSNPTDEKYTPGYGVLPIIKYIVHNLKSQSQFICILRGKLYFLI